jgi:hypothetical protein
MNFLAAFKREQALPDKLINSFILKIPLLLRHQNKGNDMGFTCKACGTTTFVLKVQPSVEQQLHITTNEFDDVLIKVGQAPPFQADLGFMNRFASCTGCGAIKQWHYTPNQAKISIATVVEVNKSTTATQ